MRVNSKSNPKPSKLHAAVLRLESDRLPSYRRCRNRATTTGAPRYSSSRNGDRSSRASRQLPSRGAGATIGEISRLRAENVSLKQQTVDYEAICGRVPAALKLGKQAPGYKATAKALDRFIVRVKGEP